jgi:phage terminase large subunit
MPSPQPLVQASAEKLQMLAELRAQKAEIDAGRLAELDVFSLIGYTPHARQREFHEATESDVLFGGSAGGGKSVSLVAEGLKWCARYRNFRCLLIRRTYDELEESIFPALRKFSYGEALGARWNSVKRELAFPNKSLFRFRYLETVDDASRRQGGEYMLVLADELCLLAPGILDFLRYERLRSDGTIPVIGVRATSNPGGPSHAEVKDRYLEATDYGRKVYTDGHGLTVRFVRSRATDNPHLDRGYLKRLDAIPDPNRRAAMRDGDWNTFSGMVFPDFSMDRHVIEPIPLPASFRRYCGTDWGFTAPYCNLWGCADEDGRVWIYREIYERQVGEAEQARRVLAAEQDDEHIVARWADDAIFALRGDAKPISTVWAEEGVHLTPAGKAPGSRIQGWQRIHSYLCEAPACPHHRAQGLSTCPMLHVFSHCRALIREIRSLPYATTGNPEDSDPKADDHALDALRYLLVNLGGGATFFNSPAPPKQAERDVLTPVGKFAVREDPGSPFRPDPDRKQGVTQSWEDAVAAMGG